MKLSIFRQKSNNSSPLQTSPKRGRLSNILSPGRFRSDPAEQLQTQHLSLASPTSDSPAGPATSPPLNSLPCLDENSLSPQFPEQQLLSDDSIALPTSQPDLSFLSSGATRLPDHKPISSDDSKIHSKSQSVSQQGQHGVVNSPDDDSTHYGSYTSGLTNMPTKSEQAFGGMSLPSRHSRPADSMDRPLSGTVSSPDDHFQTPATRLRPSAQSAHLYSDEDKISWGDGSLTQSFAGDRLSSPSAAAAQRSKQRAASSQNWFDTTTSERGSRSRSRVISSPKAAPSSESTRVSSQHYINQPQSSTVGTAYDGLHDDQPTTISTSEHLTLLQKHQASRESSSHSTRSRESDATVGADDLTTNGARTPGSGLGSRQLSRLPSFGSLTSSRSDGTESGTPRGHKRNRSSTLQATTRGNLERVIENRADKSPAMDSTPRAKPLQSGDPSDTVVARHVRNIEVPEIVARQYKASQLGGYHKTASNSVLTSSSSRTPNANNFSLKEQNVKYDKLQKECFQLKLKIYFLEEALRERSDDGVSDLIKKNAQFQAENLQLKKEHVQLRKRIKESERRIEGRIGPSSSITPSHLASEDGVSSRMMGEELEYLQKRMEDLEFENMQLTGNSAQQHLLDRLEDERSQKKDALRQVEALKHQLTIIRVEKSSKPQLRNMGSARDLADSSRPHSKTSKVSSHDTDSLTGSTLVDQVQQQRRQIHAYQGLLQAQEGMLASHNREKERLQQQIESMKLVQRRGEGVSPGSTAGDSILDRSVSRAQHRSASQASGDTRASPLSERERELFESTHGMLRNENSMLKMRVQDLQNELNGLGDGFENISKLRHDLDEAIEALKEADNNLQIQAQDIFQLENMVLQKEDEVEHLRVALITREGEQEAVRAELKKMNKDFEGMAEDSEAQQATIQSLREDISRANGELEMMEDQLQEMSSAKERFEVQQESSQNEIQFLREEQEGDKIKISDLYTALRNAKSTTVNDGNHNLELEQTDRASEEAREEARHLRRLVSQRDAELKLTREQLEDSKATSEEFSANFDGARTSYSEDIAKLQREIRHITRDLEKSRDLLSEKERLLTHHDSLLESSNHETRSLNDLLNRERQGRRHDQNEFERTLNRAKGAPEVKVLELEKSRDSDRQRVANLEQQLEEEIERRDRLLFTVWNRLSSISNTEGLAEQLQPVESSSHVSGELPSLMRQFPVTLDIIASHISSFDSKIQETEREISQDFETLSKALSERTGRIQKLEEEFANRRNPAQLDPYTVSNDKYRRMKDENKLLRREIQYMKQGSFSLPGLPTQAVGLPQQGEQAFQPSLSITREYSPSAGEDSSPEVDAMPSPLVHHGPRSKEKSKSKMRQSSALVRAHSSAEVSSPSTVRHHSFAAPTTRNGLRPSLSATNLVQNPYDGISDDGSAALSPTRQHDAHRVSHRSSSAMETAKYQTADKTWLMRLEDMRKRMKLEREGRLLDRDAARKRLLQGEKEREELKAQLKMEKDRSRFADASVRKSEAGV